MTGRATDPRDPEDVSRWRNIGIVAHINAGKTTLTERILFDTGRQRFCGDVDSGTATTDWQREEQERGISIDAVVTDVPWRGLRIQLVDTPGHVDFAAEVERSLRVLDGAIVVVDGIRGVEPQTESVWRLLDRLCIPRIVFVNKLDRSSADFDSAVESVSAALGCRPIPIVVPMPGEDGALGGLLDAVGGRFACWNAPSPSREQIEAARVAVVEACADLDEDVLRAFVDGKPVEEAALHRALRSGATGREIVPVFCGSALRNRGVEPLLDGVCRYLPSPLERLDALLPEAPADDADATLAFVFKLGIEAGAEAEEDERLALARVFRGGLCVGDVLETADGTPVRVERMFAVHAMQRSEIGRAGPGAIVGLVADRSLRTGETLRRAGTAVVLEPIRFSEPVLATRFEPRSAAGLQDLEAAAVALARGDPTLHVGTDPETGSLLVSGMGELHLDVFRVRLERRLGAEVRMGTPSVVRSETVAGPADAEAECVRAVGAQRIRALARVHVEPAPERGVVFRWAVAKPVPDGVRDEVLRELRALSEVGLHAPVPARDLAVEVQDVAFDGPPEMVVPLLAEATGLACRRAIEAGGAVELEPWVRFHVSTPAEARSAVLADLRSRGARIEEVLPGLEITELRGAAPLARLLGYATPLRSMTRGKGRFELMPEGLAATDEPSSGDAGRGATPPAGGGGGPAARPKRTPGALDRGEADR